MAKILVSYDLRIPDRDYKPLYTRLAAWNAFRVLESVWALKSDATVTQVRDDLLKYMHQKDGLLAIEMSRAGAWNELSGQSGPALKTLLES